MPFWARVSSVSFVLFAILRFSVMLALGSKACPAVVPHKTSFTLYPSGCVTRLNHFLDPFV